jgi:hypothetical protein
LRDSGGGPSTGVQKRPCIESQAARAPAGRSNSSQPEPIKGIFSCGKNDWGPSQALQYYHAFLLALLHRLKRSMQCYGQEGTWYLSCSSGPTRFPLLQETVELRARTKSRLRAYLELVLEGLFLVLSTGGMCVHDSTASRDFRGCTGTGRDPAQTSLANVH